MSRIVAGSDVCDPALPPRTSHHAQQLGAASRGADLCWTVRLAGDHLVGGRQDIRPGTGLLGPDHLYHHSVPQLIEPHRVQPPRAMLQSHWTWTHSDRRLAALTDKARGGCAGKVSA
ncbi:hypothetical protein [uncultured Paracoccus sp.]|uniref:hypothetical protein n=1 Tax=uncultured Paracoccus sp. TaxID=189685 RepID=UPI0026319AB9|nr:hypothetical protein [uncultured Paracoccus sp.]